jgi:cystathionine beta-lyase/cystathionine gamma-synthase
MTTSQPQSQSWSLDTLFVHGDTGKPATGRATASTVQPIFASTTYLHKDAETLDRAFGRNIENGEQAYVYARQGNPNAQAFEELMAQAEKGVGAVAFASGMAAIHAALLTAGLAPGAKIAVAQDLYGATIGMLRNFFLPLGVELVLLDLCADDAGDRIREVKPDAMYVETLSNPLVKVIDLDAISAAAKAVGAVSIVDSTFTTPYLVRPIEHGFDLVLHSATKYLNGHGDSTAGVVISAKKAMLDQLRTYATMLGAMLSPFESHFIMRGMKTLALRMDRHCSNAMQIAEFLQQHPSVTQVYYPGLSDHPQHARATALLDGGRYGGLLSFDLKEQTRQAAFRFMDRLALCLHATTLGDVFSLVSYPPVSSHRQLSAAERQHIGITEGCIRLSAGIENVEDIIRDLDQALRYAE